jgi:4-amino-4-deoxy-L-arabinose transferase-like glycosyltransferase
MGTGEVLSRGSGTEVSKLIDRLRGWWSHVLFPGESHAPRGGGVVLVCEAILVLTAAIIFFSQLGCPLQEPEEAMYAEISRQSLAQRHALVPIWRGQTFYDKPPLLLWMVMGTYRLFGVHDWAARLVPCTAAFLCVLLTYAWGKRAVGFRAGFAGALMLCLSPRFAQFARMVTTNALLTLCIVAALAAAHGAVAAPVCRRRWWFLSALACGLGCLTKGPVALVLVVVPVMVYLFLDRRRPRVGAGLWLAYAMLAGLVALPWFVMVAIDDPNYLYNFVWLHHIRRVLDPIDHQQPFWYYGHVLLLGTLPWSLLLPGLVIHVARPRLHAEPQRTGDVGLLLLAALWSFGFFSAAGCKRPCYILPIMPPLTLALGSYVDAACSMGRMRLAHWAGVAGATFVVLFIAAQCLLPWYADKYSVRGGMTPQVQLCSEATPVLCYPRIWDGVSFYLQRDDIRVYREEQLGDMVSALQAHPESLVVIKDDELDHLLQALPSSLEFEPCGRQHLVAVGWVRQRGLFADKLTSGGAELARAGDHRP